MWVALKTGDLVSTRHQRARCAEQFNIETTNVWAGVALSEVPYMTLYVADYMGDTRHLTTEQHGAYLLLLMTMWRSGGTLPDEPDKLARIVGLSAAKWAKIAPDVMAFFDVDSGRISQKRLRRELEKAREISQKRSRAGSAGGYSKSLKDKEAAVANAMRSPYHRARVPEPEPSPLPESQTAPSHQESLLPEDENLDRSLRSRSSVTVRSDEVASAFDAYNRAAAYVGVWPVAGKLTDTRRASLKRRLKECGGLDGWRHALFRATQSRFLRGETSREGWTADLDFLLQAKSFTKLMEGAYDDQPSGKQQAMAAGLDAFMADHGEQG